MTANEPYYASGLWGQITTTGRTVLEELTVRNVTALLGNTNISARGIKIVELAIQMAKETIKQLNEEQNSNKRADNPKKIE